MENINTNTETNNKISVADFLADNTLLSATYIPFDDKIKIVSNILNGVTKAIGGINSSILRRIATETIIESVTNIDLNIVDDNGLKGYDQLCFHRELENLLKLIEPEYIEFDTIIKEYVNDYLRVETNSALTISMIYTQMKTGFDEIINWIKDYIQGIDLSDLENKIGQLMNKEGDLVESE